MYVGHVAALCYLNLAEGITDKPRHRVKSHLPGNVGVRGKFTAEFTFADNGHASFTSENVTS